MMSETNNTIQKLLKAYSYIDLIKINNEYPYSFYFRLLLVLKKKEQKEKISTNELSFLSLMAPSNIVLWAQINQYPIVQELNIPHYSNIEEVIELEQKNKEKSSIEFFQNYDINTLEEKPDKETINTEKIENEALSFEDWIKQDFVVEKKEEPKNTLKKVKIEKENKSDFTSLNIDEFLNKLDKFKKAVIKKKK